MVNVAFFNPDEGLELNGWELQTVNNAHSNERAQALKSDGDELKARTFGSRHTLSCDYVIAAVRAILPKCGQIIDGSHIDTIKITFSQNDFVRLSVSCHKHGNGSHSECRTYSPSADIQGLLEVIDFGCPDTIPGIVMTTVDDEGNAVVGIRSVTYTLTVNHIDENDRVGEFLAAQNHDGTETIEVEFTSAVAPQAAEGWTLTNSANDKSNTAAETHSISVTRHIAHD